MALHQAARTMNDLGGDAKMMYLGLPEMARGTAKLTRDGDTVRVARKLQLGHVLKRRLAGRPLGPRVDARLRRFGVGQVTEMPADSHFVVPEIWPELADTLVRLGCPNVYFWWLSVDNFPLTQLHQLYAQRVIRDCRHLCQSEYAAQFVRGQGAASVSMLSDYIELDEIPDPKPLAARSYDIAYLPNKATGAEPLIHHLKERFNVIALQNMAREKVVSVLADTKIFLDFGPHPGKDRVPREAALCGCIPVVRKAGAANFPEDVPLPESLLVGTALFFEPEALTQRIQAILGQEQGYADSLRDYRTGIRNEKTVFEGELRALLDRDTGQ
ncbi:hypothetical protein [Cribrihabitans neustonicus]|uniref:hypothetical protein n=1 Tax=Cribrihabitans neustonicus TaxID=1429085 RepID=UPI003B5A132E